MASGIHPPLITSSLAFHSVGYFFEPVVLKNALSDGEKLALAYMNFKSGGMEEMADLIFRLTVYVLTEVKHAVMCKAQR